MNKKEFVKELAENMDVSQADAERILTQTFWTIKDLMVKGDDISIPGFGKFLVKKQKARKGRNPSTGDTIDIPEKNVPKFKASSTFKDMLT